MNFFWAVSCGKDLFSLSIESCTDSLPILFAFVYIMVNSDLFYYCICYWHTIVIHCVAVVQELRGVYLTV